MIMENLNLNLYAFAYSCLRLVIGAYVACRRIRLFREPDGITLHIYSGIPVQRHRVGDSVRMVTPPREVDPFAYHAKVPWAWIGANEDLADYTEDLAPFMVPGNLITSDLIRGLFPEIGSEPIRYLDSTTFELKPLPSEGIVIEHGVPTRG